MFPSDMALRLAVRRFVYGTTQGNNQTFKEAVEAGVTTAINYDGAKIVQEIFNDFQKRLNAGAIIYTDLRIEDAQDIWDKINGKDKPKAS